MNLLKTWLRYVGLIRRPRVVEIRGVQCREIT